MKIKKLKSKLLVSVVVTVFAVVLYLFKIPCPFLTVTGVKCFGCGMTRALLSALKFDITTAFDFHIMFWAVPILYLCFLKDGKLFKNKTLNIMFYILIAIGFVLNWLRWIIL